MVFNHLIPCCPPLLLPSTFPSIRVFSSELVLHIRWPKCWSFSFSFSRSSLDFALRVESCCDWDPPSSLPHSRSSLWNWKAVPGPSLDCSWREQPRSLFTHHFSVFGVTEIHQPSTNRYWGPASVLREDSPGVTYLNPALGSLCSATSASQAPASALSWIKLVPSKPLATQSSLSLDWVGGKKEDTLPGSTTLFTWDCCFSVIPRHNHPGATFLIEFSK